MVPRCKVWPGFAARRRGASAARAACCAWGEIAQFDGWFASII